MIKSYKISKTEKVHLTGTPKGFKGLDGARDRKGQWSMTINLPWVVCFTPMKSGEWENVKIVDCH